jgi:predicted DCC family thiol-disulfide oxidoreductase YuxK
MVELGESMKVIFFDGVCGLCNGFIDFVIKIDKKHEFNFSPLQSEYAQEHLPPEMTKDLKSVIYQSGEDLFTKSDAVMRILSEIGGVWKLVSLGKVLPKAFRDAAYELVAENRYRIFGKKETCRLPTPEERSRFVI